MNATERNSGPSAEDVWSLLRLMNHDGGRIGCNHAGGRCSALSDWLAAHTAAAKREGARGIRFRVEVACDGYAHLMDEDVPSNESDLAAYQQGAHDAAEAIRAVLIEGGA